MPDIRHSIQIGAPAEAVHSLVAGPSGLQQWWAEDVTSDSDGVLSLGFFKRATIYRLRLIQGEPTSVVWKCETGDEWRETRLAFALTPTRSGVGLEFTHAGWREATPYFISCNTTWGGLMFRLRAAAEGKRPGPLFLKDALAY
jgi:uncharacterized protein YndB with AHSA1/START domain